MANSLKAADLRAKSSDELKEELLGLRKESFNLRFQAASGQLENTARCRQVTRGIARIKTILGEQSARCLALSRSSKPADGARADSTSCEELLRRSARAH